MKAIARKPCSFGGRDFFINDEIPTELILDLATQEKLGVIVVVNDDGTPAGTLSGMFTQAQVDEMLAEKVAYYEELLAKKDEELANATSILDETQLGDSTISISVKGEGEESIGVFIKPEELQQVFDIMQCTAEEGAKLISEVQNDDVLILLNAADSRKTIKDATKKQHDNLSNLGVISNESDKGNASTE